MSLSLVAQAKAQTKTKKKTEKKAENEKEDDAKHDDSTSEEPNISKGDSRSTNEISLVKNEVILGSIIVLRTV